MTVDAKTSEIKDLREWLRVLSDEKYHGVLWLGYTEIRKRGDADLYQFEDGTIYSYYRQDRQSINLMGAEKVNVTPSQIPLERYQRELISFLHKTTREIIEAYNPDLVKTLPYLVSQKSADSA